MFTSMNTRLTVAFVILLAPAFAIAGESKLPVAESPIIGSDKTDVTGWFIASKRAGRWDTHANVGYTWVGRPPGASVQNVYSYGLAEEFHATQHWELVGEVYGSTAALAESNDVALAARARKTPRSAAPRPWARWAFACGFRPASRSRLV